MFSRQEIELKVRSVTLATVKQKTGRGLVPLGVSNRHIHLSIQDMEKLFGAGYTLTRKNAIAQPGQFAAEETLTLIGPKGRFEKVRVLGPPRKETQVEISLTDSFTLGIKAPIRLSGDLAGTPGAELVGPKGKITIPGGVIIAARHAHFSAEEAAAFGVHDGEIIRLQTTGERAIVLENVIVRAGDGHLLELHLDTDEANAAALKNGDLLEIIR